MKCVLFPLCFLCAIFVHVQGWTGIIMRDPTKAHLGDCYTSSHNLGAFRTGEIKRLEGQCGTATCGTSGNIRLTGCGSVRVEKPYKIIPGDLSKPFPDCCFEIIGPITESTEEPEE